MKNLILAVLLALSLTGCGNLSPRFDPKLDQKIDNQGGKIDSLKNNQNGIMSEIGTLKNQAEILNSRLDRVQQGILNLQSNNDNHGVQILSGSGGLLIAAISILVGGFLVLHFRSTAKMHEKTANILAEKIVDLNSPEVVDAVFQAAMYTDVEENMLKIMKNKTKA